jgi:hypothetical protein
MPERDNLYSFQPLPTPGKEVIVKYAIHDQVTLSQAPEGPLAAHLVSFADAISSQGYRHNVDIFNAFYGSIR